MAAHWRHQLSLLLLDEALLSLNASAVGGGCLCFSDTVLHQWVGHT